MVQDSGHILVVDDNKVGRMTLAKMLINEGYRVTEAEGGFQALEYLQNATSENVDAVLLDILMPDLDGYQLLEKIKQDPGLHYIPVIMVSALDEMDSVVRCIEIGATDYLTKPIQQTLLRARLNASLTEKRLHDLELRYLHSLERELEIGQDIQRGFLPKVIPQPAGWEIEAYFQAARIVAGDYYDVFEVEAGKVAFLLGDVTDKGVGSALYMAMIRTLLRAAVMVDNFTDGTLFKERPIPEIRVHQAITLVNKYLCQVHDSAMFSTLFMGILEADTGKICYVNAGQDVPFWTRDGQIIAQLNPTGPLVGLFEEANYQIKTIYLQAGDSLVLYSDGVTDACNPAGEVFGTNRWQDKVKQSVMKGESPVTYLTSQIQDFICNTQQVDDISLLFIQRKL